MPRPFTSLLKYSLCSIKQFDKHSSA